MFVERPSYSKSSSAVHSSVQLSLSQRQNESSDTLAQAKLSTGAKVASASDSCRSPSSSLEARLIEQREAKARSSEAVIPADELCCRARLVSAEAAHNLPLRSRLHTQHAQPLSHESRFIKGGCSGHRV